MQLIFFVILIFSIILHEVAHGFAADRLGDPTARISGRLTLSPLPHIDLFGSILLPALSILSPGGFIFGWAKPVPYNPYNLHRAPRWGEVIVAAAGPLTNIVLAALFVLLIRVYPDPSIRYVFLTGLFANIWLTIVNLIPVPPLDGSKIIFGSLPYRLGDRFRAPLEQNPLVGLMIVLGIVVLCGSLISHLLTPFAYWLAGL